ncbi:MAG: c-type cytochrome [Pseudomonadota bacterium]
MRSLIFTLCLLLVAPAMAAGDAAAGQALYATCSACHGAQGEGNEALNAPRLTHLEPVYIVAQLQKFKDGLRGGAGASPAAMQMAPMAAVLPDTQAMLNVSAYIATLGGGQSAATVEGDATLGGDYYNQFCGACHGAGAIGNTALNSPRLAGADDWYLLAQVEAFRGGSRGAHPDDRTGRQMTAMAAILPSDQAVRDVVAYIRSLED